MPSPRHPAPSAHVLSDRAVRHWAHVIDLRIDIDEAARSALQHAPWVARDCYDVIAEGLLNSAKHASERRAAVVAPPRHDRRPGPGFVFASPRPVRQLPGHDFELFPDAGTRRPPHPHPRRGHPRGLLRPLLRSGCRVSRTSRSDAHPAAVTSSSPRSAGHTKTNGCEVNQLHDLLPLAVGMLISPLPIVAIVAIISLRADARRHPPMRRCSSASSLVFIVGALTSAGSSSASPSGTAKTVSFVLAIVLTLGFAALAIASWLSRPRHGQPPKAPAWLAALDSVTPAKASGSGPDHGGHQHEGTSRSR